MNELHLGWKSTLPITLVVLLGLAIVIGLLQARKRGHLLGRGPVFAGTALIAALVLLVFSYPFLADTP